MNLTNTSLIGLLIVQHILRLSACIQSVVSAGKLKWKQSLYLRHKNYLIMLYFHQKFSYMKAIITAIVLFISYTLTAQDKIEDHIKIYDTRTKQVVTADNIVADVAHANVLFFG